MMPLTESFCSQLLCNLQPLLDLSGSHGKDVCIRIGARTAGIGWVSEEVARGPEKLDACLLLELQSEVCHLIQILVGLLQCTAHGGNVPDEK